MSRPDPIDWTVAAKVAAKLSGTDPFATSYHGSSLVSDFATLTPRAEALVTLSTGLVPDGPATARVVSRPEWINNNIRSFQRMLRPITDRMGVDNSLWAPAARVAAGVEVGTILGVLSKRVLGQYDLIGAGDEDNPQDEVAYVGPNVLAIEKKFAFPPSEFRLWLALHEVTHRAQFTGVPWMRGYFTELTHRTLGSADPDPRRFLIALKRTVDAVRSGRSPFDDGGLLALLADDDQRDALDRMGGLMSLLEGHGDITMDRAGIDHIPSAGRFSATLRQRRHQTKPVLKLVQQVTGFEAKLRQYEEGERFIEAVEAARGSAFLDHVWTSPDRLPTLEEIRAPALWIERVELLSSPAPEEAPRRRWLRRRA
jgi:coenzyme F420 biosynthesis associated uncharacterized protein